MRKRFKYKQQLSRQEGKSAPNWGLQMFALVLGLLRISISEIDSLTTIQMRPLIKV